METNNQNHVTIVPRTRDMQETINHLVLGITMWVSVTVSCVTTLLTVHQAWCLIAMLIPFVYTMFPQIQKAANIARENAVNNYKTKQSINKNKKDESSSDDILRKDLEPAKAPRLRVKKTSSNADTKPVREADKALKDAITEVTQNDSSESQESA